MPFTKEYKKLRLIGKGSFAAVYKVRHKDLGYIRAIKISNEMVENEDDKAYRAFLNECRLLLKIGNGCHPNIVHIYQPRFINNRALVEMDYIDGITLMEYLRENKFMPMNEFWNFALGIVGAVGYCHADLYKFLMDPESDSLEPDPDDDSKFIISATKEKELRHKYCVNHNDLHSNNIMRRNYDGAYVLLDFGLAIQEEECVKSSARGAGAHEYSSPEKLGGEDITAASDVYSLGILLYEALAGRVPFVLKNQTLIEVSRLYDRHLNEQPAPIEPSRKEAYENSHPGENYTRDFPEALERVILKCLAKKPSDRYSDAKEVLDALKSAQAMSGKQECVSADDTISALRKEIERLTKENDSLRRESSKFGSTTSGRVNSHSLVAGQPYGSGTVAYVDHTGEHGLLVVSTTYTPMKWNRKIYTEDYDRMNTESRLWYSDNCFIIPAGTHIPSSQELRLILENAHVLGWEQPVWVNDSPDGSMAFDPTRRATIPAQGTLHQFIAVKRF